MLFFLNCLCLYILFSWLFLSIFFKSLFITNTNELRMADYEKRFPTIPNMIEKTPEFLCNFSWFSDKYIVCFISSLKSQKCATKGQLISKQIYEVIVFSHKANEILQGFHSLFGKNDDFINLFWDLLTFDWESLLLATLRYSPEISWPIVNEI